MKKFHYFSGLLIAAFIGIHLINHVYSVFGAEKHIEIMNTFRNIYRNNFMEAILVFAILIQVISGIRLFIRKRKSVSTGFEKLQLWTGLYLSIFFAIHLSAVFTGRILLKLDTNFYFGAAGLNSFPHNLFFIPYYGLAVLSFFGHVASVHSKKMKVSVLGLSPKKQSLVILAVGLFATFVIFYGLTNHFEGISLPQDYGVLVGK